ncbi:MAG: hypothetical protein EDR02_11620 [Actinobacteria bacterium]|nr:MAG: hypothetical protein EDR02_11620 [Actinomycetota bacterium]RIK05330.1 MAG: hypothetical protein DCC48_10660 [Acidobacteriota bacterium]
MGPTTSGVPGGAQDGFAEGAEGDTVYIVSPRGQPLMELQAIGSEEDRLVLQGRLMGRFPSRMYSSASETGKLLRKVAGRDVVAYLPRWPAFWAAEAIESRVSPAQRARRADLTLLAVLAGALLMFFGALGWIAADAPTAGPLLLISAVALLPAAAVLRGHSPASLTAVLLLFVFGVELGVAGAGWATLDQLPMVGLPLLAAYTAAGEWLAHRGRAEPARAFNRAVTMVAVLQTVFVLFQLEQYLSNGVAAAMVALLAYLAVHGLRWFETGLPVYGFLLAGTLTLAVLLGLAGWTTLEGVGLAPPVGVLGGVLALAAGPAARRVPPLAPAGLPGAAKPEPRRRGVWPLASASLVLGTLAALSARSEPAVCAGVLLVVGAAWLSAGLSSDDRFAWRGAAATAGHLAAAASLVLLVLAGDEDPVAVGSVAAGWALALAAAAGGNWTAITRPQAPQGSWAERVGVRWWAARVAAYAAGAFSLLAANVLADPATGSWDVLWLAVPVAVWAAATGAAARVGPPGEVAAAVLLATALTASGTILVTDPSSGAGLVAVTLALLGTTAVLARAGLAVSPYALPVAAPLLLGALVSWLGAGEAAGLVPLALALGLAGVAARRGTVEPTLAAAAYAACATGLILSPSLPGAVAAVLLLLPQAWPPASRPGRLPRAHDLVAALLVGAAALGFDGYQSALGLVLAGAAGVLDWFTDPGPARRWSPVVGLVSCAALAASAPSPAAALPASAGVAAATLLGRGALRWWPDPPTAHLVADGGDAAFERARLLALASLPAAALSGYLIVNAVELPGYSIALAAAGLGAAALGASGGLAPAAPLAGLVPLAALGWSSAGGSSFGEPFALMVAGLGVTMLALLAAPASWASSDPDGDPSPSSRLRSGQAAVLGAQIPVQVTVAWLLVGGDERAGRAALWALVISALGAVLLRALSLAALAAADLAAVVFVEAGRLQASGSDLVAVWFLTLSATVALATVVAQFSAARGRRANTGLRWVGRNRAVLATGWLLAGVVLVALLVSGVVIVWRDPLVNGGVSDLLARIGDWLVGIF